MRGTMLGRLRAGFLLALGALRVGPASAQQAPPADSLLEHMAGKWVLAGTIADPSPSRA